MHVQRTTHQEAESSRFLRQRQHSGHHELMGVLHLQTKCRMLVGYRSRFARILLELFGVTSS
jgi:hypothetical protein